jgi:acetyltransferase-like isoleucine patch superfamily enzyme
MPLCVINGESLIGDGVIVNTRSSVDHHSVLMNFSSIAPGVTLGGRVKIGERSAISIGTYVRNSINIGSDTVVGVGSVVLHDIPSNTVAYGIPAKTIRSRSRGEKYL